MKKILIILTVLLAFQGKGIADTINWDDTLKKIIANSYDLKISQIDINISDTKIKGARSEYFPKLGLYSYNEYSRDLSSGKFQTTYIGNDVIFADNLYQNSLSLGLNYSLYDFGIKRDNLNIAKQDKKSKRATYYKTLRDLELTTIDIYSKALIASDEISVKNQILEIQKELSLNKKRLNSAGKIPKTATVAEDIKNVKIENEIAKAKNDLSKLLKDLSYFTRVEYNEKDLVIEKFKDIKQIDKSVFEVKVEKRDFLDLAQSPEFKIYDAEITKKEKELRVAKKQTLPMFNFSTNYYLYGSDPSSFWSSYDDFGQRGIKFRLTTSLPIFDGLKNKSERERLALEIERLKIEKEQKLSDLYRNYSKIQDDADYAQKQVFNNRKMLDLVNENIAMLDRLDANKLIDREVYLNQKIELLNRKLETEESQINDFASGYKLDVLTKYNEEVGRI